MTMKKDKYKVKTCNNYTEQRADSEKSNSKVFLFQIVHHGDYRDRSSVTNDLPPKSKNKQILCWLQIPNTCKTANSAKPDQNVDHGDKIGKEADRRMTCHQQVKTQAADKVHFNSSSSFADHE